MQINIEVSKCAEVRKCDLIYGDDIFYLVDR